MNRVLNTSLICVLVFVSAVSTHIAGQTPNKSHEAAKPPVVRYYITTKVKLATPYTVSMHGASNLPPGSVFIVHVSDYIGEGSKDINDETRVVVGKDGLFRAYISPKKGLSFQTNQVCCVLFSPGYPQQPESVIKVVGASGENLIDPGNPQLHIGPKETSLEDYTVVRE